MRTTVTLDDDLLATLQQLAGERGTTFKEVLNATIRAGLKPTNKQPVPPLPSRSMGLRPSINLDRAALLVDEMEDAEVMRKLELRK
ncbi:MAG: ribbon-helix-helix protein, CopG family [Propionibacteriaceae bacterium]|nr:ribbon-helix-helix protein, CopG family [Propionibacteriaceae bacterium]